MKWIVIKNKIKEIEHEVHVKKVSDIMGTNFSFEKNLIYILCNVWDKYSL